MVQLILMDILISLLDIAFLATLIYVINFYTESGHSTSFSFFPFSWFAKYPLSLIIVFFFLFAIKNGLGYLIFKMQYHFIYAVAARLSKNNPLHFLQGSYTDYVQT